MGEGGANPIAGLPPTAWILIVLLGGGGTIGGLQMGGGGTAPPVGVETCGDAESRAREALAAWQSMLDSYGLILAELNECQQTE